MPKMKTSRGAKKRFRLSGTGKVLRRHAMKSHNLEKKSSKRRRGFRKTYGVAASDLRSSSIPAFLTPSMKRLYERPFSRAAALMRMIQS